ncbi:C-C motif chemokine 24-like [Ambystoma mexicanum]|uniref:C-C motif chemokine 24-like n=1 Tax=Ambystoma mexicanum TaxID=8296 RepID=UPI0037E9692F
MSGINKVLPIALVLVLCAMAFVSSDAGKESTCCTQVSNSKRNEHNIVKYQKQEINPPCVQAVIFTLQDKTSMCSNPKLKWVERKMKELDEKERQKVTVNRR